MQKFPIPFFSLPNNLGNLPQALLGASLLFNLGKQTSLAFFFFFFFLSMQHMIDMRFFQIPLHVQVSQVSQTTLRFGTKPRASLSAKEVHNLKQE